jgi:dephospho-CoA kinase
MSYRGKPIIGIVGGIGSGKSFVARLLGELGCAVIDSDAVAHAVYAEPAVVVKLVGWYGPDVLKDGAVDRAVIAHDIFRDADHRQRLESLIHPRIHAEREREMAARVTDPTVKAFVWDSPLLIEAGLHTQCDVVIFVDVPYEERLRRVRESRGWDATELDRREASQMPLEEKRQLATTVMNGDAGVEELREQLRRVL